MLIIKIILNPQNEVKGEIMKKISSLFIALLMVFSLNVTSVTAESVDSVQTVPLATNMQVETNVRHIRAEDNYVLTDGSYLIDESSLVGTELEGKTVLVTEHGIYADGKIWDEIAIYVRNKLIGYFINGAIVYVSGYTGTQLATAAISAIVALVSAHPAGFFALMALAAFTAAVVMSYETSTGNECILSPSGGYTCKYSV